MYELREIKFAPNQTLPEGYRVYQLDSGHYLWINSSGEEGAINVNRFKVRKEAWMYYKETND